MAILMRCLACPHCNRQLIDVDYVTCVSYVPVILLKLNLLVNLRFPFSPWNFTFKVSWFQNNPKVPQFKVLEISPIKKAVYIVVNMIKTHKL